MEELKKEIKNQIDLLTEEQYRVKMFLVDNRFVCTTAPWVLAKQYRDSLKKHINILRENLDGLEDFEELEKTK
jgi:hypothetical protein